MKLAPYLYNSIFIAFILAACHREISKEKNTDKYLDVKSIVKYVEKDLYARKPQVKKTMMIGGNTSQTTLPGMEWYKELAPFYSIDLNKPAFRNSFGVITRTTDTSYANFYIKRKDAGKSDIEVVIASFSTTNKLKSIVAKTGVKNIMYEMQKKCELVFDTMAYPGLELKSYKLDGSQGFKWFGNKESYTVVGVIMSDGLK